MKLFTDVDQSKSLASILPHKSADMNYKPYAGENGKEYEVNLCKYLFTNWIAVPCWSLASLIDILPNEIITHDTNGNEYKYQIDIRKFDDETGATKYQIAYGNVKGGAWFDLIHTQEMQNLIDCCVNMILTYKSYFSF